MKVSEHSWVVSITMVVCWWHSVVLWVMLCCVIAVVRLVVILWVMMSNTMSLVVILIMVWEMNSVMVLVVIGNTIVLLSTVVHIFIISIPVRIVGQIFTS